MSNKSQSRYSSNSRYPPLAFHPPQKLALVTEHPQVLMDEAPSVSYIIIHDLSPDAKLLYLSPSLTEVLGYEPLNIIGSSSFDWIHPDEVEAARQLHYDTIRQDKAAAMAYLRIRNLDDDWVHCVIQRTLVYNALVGSISFAKPGAKALHTAATAQEVTFLTPTPFQMQLQFRRWNDPAPPAPPPPTTISSLDLRSAETFRAIPTPSRRTGLILNRFSRQCTIMYCTNDCIVPASRVTNRSFYDFVSPSDEVNVRGWIDVSKGWAVSETGQPSDGGFVFGSFRMCLEGRNSAHGESRARGRGNSMPVSRGQDDNGLQVDAIFSAHSDGFIVVLRKGEHQ